MTQHGTPSHTAVSFFDNGIALSNAVPTASVWSTERKTLPPEKTAQNGKETVKFFSPIFGSLRPIILHFFRAIRSQMPLAGVPLSTSAKTLPPPQNGKEAVKFFPAMLGHLRLLIFRVIRPFHVKSQRSVGSSSGPEILPSPPNGKENGKVFFQPRCQSAIGNHMTGGPGKIQIWSSLVTFSHLWSSFSGLTRRELKLGKEKVKKW